VLQTVSVESTVVSLPLGKFLDYLEDNFRYTFDRTLTKSKEDKLIKLRYTKEVSLFLLAKRVLRQVDLEDVVKHPWGLGD
jgi:hypothetical protein